MSKIRSCSNCKKSMRNTLTDGLCACLDYEMGTTEEEWIEAAKDCTAYEFGEPDCLMEIDEEYCPSSTNGDYGPSNPWDAPGMSIHDFI